MGNVAKSEQRQWRSDDLAQAIVDRLVERAENPVVTLLYGKVRPVVQAEIAEIFGPMQVRKGRRKRNG